MDKRLIFFDLDGTLRHPKSGAQFINDPYDQEPIEGAAQGVAYFASKGFVCVGVTNQGGVAAGHKSLDDATLEQKITLDLFPGLDIIYFCPTWGDRCLSLDRNGISRVYDAQSLDTELSFRKPGAGMLVLVAKFLGTDIQKSWMVGDRPEDKGAAIEAGSRFISALAFQLHFSGKAFPADQVFDCFSSDLRDFLAL